MGLGARGNAVTRLRSRRGTLQKELLLLPSLALMRLVRRFGRRLCGLCKRLGRRLELDRPLLPLRRALLAVLILAAAPTAPMPLRLHLAIGRGWPQFSLGLRRFCRHACTSWQCSV